MSTGRLLDYGLILATIAFSVYGQLVLKWRMDQTGALPQGFGAALAHLLRLLLDPLVLSSFAAAFVASLAWMAALTRFELSHAYPFTSLSFVAVLVLGAWLLGEQMTLHKAAGVGFIVLGTVLVGLGPAGR